jgi:hypothetical protein
MVTGQGYGRGIGGCNRLCPTATGHSLVALFFLSVSIKDRSLQDPGQVTDLLSRAHTCLRERKDLLLSCYRLRLFPDRLIRGGDRWRSKHLIEAEPQVWRLGVQVWTRTWNPWQVWNGLVSLMPGAQARGVFFGYPARHIDSRITVSTWRYDWTTLWHCSKNWHMKDGKIALIAQPLLEYRTGAYMECWIMNKTWLLII